MPHFRRLLITASVSFVWLVSAADPVAGADRAAIDNAISKGVGYLRSQIGVIEGGEKSLTALALIKTNVDHHAPEIEAAARSVQEKVVDGKYKPGGHHVYEAGADASFLVDLDAEKYLPELRAISQYLISVQRPNGSWDYPTGRDTNGDTSVTQYACLGLWSAARAGVEVPPQVWDKVLRWLIAGQHADGGYQYVPGSTEGWWKGETNLNMAVAGGGALLIAARELFPQVADQLYAGEIPRESRSATGEDPALLGVLQKIDTTTAPPPEGAAPANGPTVALQDVRRALDRLKGWLGPRFRPANDTIHFPYYYFYSVERMGALANVSQIGQYQWYDSCADVLVSVQKSDGSWSPPRSTIQQPPVVDTSFAVLFLARSTGKILKRTVPEESVGGGLLTGGQGAPVEVVAAKKEPTPLDQLLASLQNPGSLDLGSAQQDLVEQVQLGNKEDLVGQKEQLVKLIEHPHGEVRRTAAWALGRTNDLHLARYLVEALEDPDLGVMIEAHASLCWLSRRFDGFGLAVNPLDDLDANASDAEKETAIRGWRVRARRAWGNWYLRVRPYSDRGDEFEAQLRQRLADQ